MISVITPTYNRLKSLQSCVQSIIDEYYDGLELIVIDDCSTDGSIEWLEHIQKIHPFIKVINCSENAGVNVARNKGILLSSQPYILFLDSDDQLVPGSLQKILTYIYAYPKQLHFLTWLTYRKNQFEENTPVKKVFYSDWVSQQIDGDYTHIVVADVMKQFLFFEQFRMFEQLNWFRVFKFTSPQLLLPIAVSEIDLSSSDSLSKAVKKRKLSNLKAAFDSEFLFYQMFRDDMIQFNPAMLSGKLIKTIIVGISCKRKKEIVILKGFALNPVTKLMATILILLPSSLMSKILLTLKRIEID